MRGITIVGLGPGAPEMLTLEARATLEQAGEIWVRTRHHPVVEALPTQLTVHSFDDLYETSPDFPTLYRDIAEQVVTLGQRPHGVLYGVPGSPWVGEATVRLIVKAASQRGLHVRVVQGMSFIEPVLSALKLDALDGLQVADATAIAARHFPPLEADRPALIAQLYSRLVASEVKIVLMALYPHDHPVTLVKAAGTPDQQVLTCPLHELDHRADWRLLTSLYVPPLPAPASLSAFMDIIFHLRSPEGCPWDREQDHLSLRPFLIEEAYEVLHALDCEDVEALREELGDLWLQIALHTQMATEEGAFTVADVLATVSQKMIRRHPHVFGDVDVSSAQEVLRNWEQLKREEKKHSESPHLLEGVPPGLPALLLAQKAARRAAALGWHPPSPEELWQAWRQAPSTEVLGRLLLAVAEEARRANVDAESALREAVMRLAGEQQVPSSGNDAP
ncbi:MAG: MazG family protein [Ardenticatenia bacterium]|nr:MazG family protein [Ardenticatenia bacterium]